MSISTTLSSKKAKKANNFIDSIGVNIHLHYQDKVYSKKYDDIIKPRLIELGVRHVRDGAMTYDGISQNTFYYRRVRDLANQDIQFTFIAPALKTSWGEPTNYDLLDEVYQWSNGAIAAFEGTNEPELQNVSTWVEDTRSGQKQLYQKVKSDPLLSHIPVIGPSVTVLNNGINKVGDLSQWLDYGNLHNYFSSYNPDTDGWASSIKGYGSVEWSLSEAEKVSGNKAVMTTETGWDNSLPSASGSQGIPEDVTAKYIPRLFLNQFNEGIVRTIAYELIDIGTNPKVRDQNLGLLRNDGSPKPSFIALKNLISLLEDPDPNLNFTSEKLTFALEGEIEGIEHTLLQKSNGDFYLALWQAELGWDASNQQYLKVTDQAVTLSLQDIQQATLYQFDSQGSVKTSAGAIADNQLKLSIKDTVTVIKLTPESARSAPVLAQSLLSPVSYEAEGLTLSGGYVIESHRGSKASNGQFIALRKGNNGAAAGFFQGDAGIYDVKVHYFDENDGVSSASVTVADNTKSFLLDKDLPANYASSKALTSRVTHQDLVLNPGDRFELKGTKNRGEYVRFDRIEFIPVGRPVDSIVAGRSSLGSTSNQALFSGLDKTAYSGLLDYKGTEAGIASVSTDTVSLL
ncbi:hypothetical protein IQ241_03335 [Romeria aff. gracilis LEGE 07310]|uniref:Uncharacterized protein n=1 Tax=Vasconcelosia minhoensis LEGE 07310 TaxID=915328 RepID=A0A8J7ATM8_9CYAN|nr:hypothetical protein [Romeria gracilis]MBE9076338.1 hypothetical protein [Romeria aff. gracilis LEGE 07310]